MIALPDFAVIGITSPGCWSDAEEEACAISRYLGGPVDLMHIRKPEGPPEYAEHLVDAIPLRLHERLVWHSPYEISKKEGFAGRHSVTSRSCHSVAQLEEPSEVVYSFLSPIFDSISKPGYMSRFSLEDPMLREVLSRHNVMALGGVKPEYFEKLVAAKFAGAALLGYLWNPKTSFDHKILTLQEAKDKVNKLN